MTPTHREAARRLLTDPATDGTPLAELLSELGALRQEVQEMRDEQRMYFRTRGHDVLARSRRLELRVDARLDRLRALLAPQQGSLL